MSTYSTIPKILFDPEIYIEILNQITKNTGQTNINLYTIMFLNSFYMNEFIDQDLIWVDENEEEQRSRIDARIQSLIKVGSELLNINNTIESEKTEQKPIKKLEQKQSYTQPPVQKLEQKQQVQKQAEGSLFDLMEQMPVNEDDPFLSKVNKFNNEVKNKTATKNVTFG